MIIHNPKPKSSVSKKIIYDDDMDLQTDDLQSDIQLTPIQNNIMEILKRSKDEFGVPYEQILNHLKGDFGQEQIKEAILNLFDHGLIFSLKEDHFKITVINSNH